MADLPPSNTTSASKSITTNTTSHTVAGSDVSGFVSPSPSPENENEGTPDPESSPELPTSLTNRQKAEFLSRGFSGLPAPWLIWAQNQNTEEHQIPDSNFDCSASHNPLAVKLDHIFGKIVRFS